MKLNDILSSMTMFYNSIYKKKIHEFLGFDFSLF